MTAPATADAAPDPSVDDAGIFLSPSPWNGAAVAASLAWCRKHQAPYFCRLVLVGLAIIADRHGAVGVATIPEIADLVGLTVSITRDSRRWLITRGAILEAGQAGQPKPIWISPAVAACDPDLSEPVPSIATPEPAAPSRPRPESGKRVSETITSIGKEIA